VAPNVQNSSRGRAAAASFWLGVLFHLTAAAPALVCAVRPVFVRLAFFFSRKIRQSTDANARRILGEGATAKQRREFGIGVVTSFYDFVCDIGRSLRQTREELSSRIESAEGESAYHAVRAAGNGAILLTAHMGSFEVGLVALAAHEKRIHVVFKRDQVGSFEKLRTQLRRQLNVAEAPIDDGYAVWVGLRSALMNNEVVAIQGDRVMPGQKGVSVLLLGGHVQLPTGPFKLALASGSPVIPIFSIRSKKGGIRIFLEKAIVVSNEIDGIERAVGEFAVVLARYIAQYPDQWLVLNKAFCEDAAGTT
jgi:KDO2-lipid IV(A) lauroyltransferase